MTKPPRYRAVLDTNVIVAALRSRNPNSPTAELLRRWQADEFDFIYSAALKAEYVEHLTAHDLDPQLITAFMEQLTTSGDLVEVSEVERIVGGDADDDHVLACAITGNATQIVTYDAHLLELGAEYRGIQLTKALPFLYLVRGDTPPE